MTPRTLTSAEAEQLLGGYAAGILTEPERAALFQAAMAHQELFDALADEEVLRELLADPAAKQRLLEALAESAPKPRRLRPAAWMGLAAAAVLAVAVGLRARREGLLRSDAAAPKQADTLTPKPPPRIVNPQDAAPAAKAEPKSEAGTDTKPEAKHEATQAAKPADQPPAPAPVAEAAPAPPPPPKEAPAPSGAAMGGFLAAQKDAKRARERVPEQSYGNQAGAAAGAAATPPALDKSQSSRTESVHAAAQAEITSMASIAPGVAADAVPRAEARKAASAPFTHELRQLPKGRWRLDAAWPQGRALYLLKRSGQAVALLPPQAPPTARDGVLHARFEFALDAQDALDLYLLDQPATDPAALPAQGPVAGQRVRLFP